MILMLDTDNLDRVMMNDGLSGLKTHVYNKYTCDRNNNNKTQIMMNIHLYGYLKSVAHAKGVRPHKILEEIIVDHISKGINDSKFY